MTIIASTTESLYHGPLLLGALLIELFLSFFDVAFHRSRSNPVVLGSKEPVKILNTEISLLTQEENTVHRS